jgi:hypothetical protein
VFKGTSKRFKNSLFTNKKVMAHNDQEFLEAIGPTFCFEAIDIRHHSLLASYKIPTDPNKTAGLHKTIKVKKDMLIELCNNYVISDELVNGADGLFKAPTSCNNKSYIWIFFLIQK